MCVNVGMVMMLMIIILQDLFSLCFYEASKLALGDSSILKAYTKTIILNHMDAGRPKRDRKMRVISDPSTY